MNSIAGKTMLSKKEMEVSDTLDRLNIPKRDARILLCILKKDGIMAMEIERNADLRQPEVSMGTNALKKRGWIRMEKIKKKGKGRPYYRFYIAKPKEAIISDIQEKMQERIQKEKQNIDVLYDLLGVKK